MSSVLVMFSGGKDSMLTACCLTKSYDNVSLLSFNNGSVAHEEIFKHSAQRLCNKYGSVINWVGVRSTLSEFRRYVHSFYEKSILELSDKYKHVSICQANCLCCQTAMWVNSIAYCLSKNIDAVASGYKLTDEFCTGSELYHTSIKSFANAYNIAVEFPVINVCDVDKELLMNSMLPVVYEPKCCLGCPADIKFYGKCEDDLMSYFEHVLMPYMKRDIDKLVQIFNNIRITDESLEACEFELPDDYNKLF